MNIKTGEKEKKSLLIVREHQENVKMDALTFDNLNTDVLTTNTSPVTMSLSTTNQASLCPPILALWPSVSVNQPVWTETHKNMRKEGTNRCLIVLYMRIWTKTTSVTFNM